MYAHTIIGGRGYFVFYSVVGKRGKYRSAQIIIGREIILHYCDVGWRGEYRSYRSPTLEHSLHKLLLGGEIFLFTTLMWGEEGNIVGIQTRANRVGDCFLIFCWLVISNLCVLYLNIFWWCSCSMELSRKINVLHSDSYKKLLSPNCVSIPKHILISKFFWWSLCSKGLRRNRHFALSDSLPKFCHLQLLFCT